MSERDGNINWESEREKFYLFASKFLSFVDLHKYLDPRVCRFVWDNDIEFEKWTREWERERETKKKLENFFLFGFCEIRFMRYAFIKLWLLILIFFFFLHFCFMPWQRINDSALRRSWVAAIFFYSYIFICF